MTQQHKSNLSDKLRNIVCVLRNGGMPKEHLIRRMAQVNGLPVSMVRRDLNEWMGRRWVRAISFLVSPR